MNKELVIFNPSIEDGGVEKNLFLISNYLANNKINTTIISADINKKYKFDKKIKFLTPSNINFSNAGRYKKYFFCLILLIKRILFKKNCYIFSFQANIYSIIVSKLLGAKIIVRMNTAPHGWDHNWLKKIIYNYYIKRADGIIVNSKLFKKEVEKRFNVKSFFINNPFDFKKINKLSRIKIKSYYPKKSLKLITIGRLTEQKDHITILKSMSILKKMNLNFRLIIIGKGHLKKKLINFVIENNLSKNVKFLGYKKNPFPYLKQAKIFILSSLYEGSPNVLVEALYLKKDVISTNCPTGPKEILKNGKYGLLYKIRDHKQLTKKILSLNNNHKLFPTNILKKYDIELTCKHYMNHLNHVFNLK
jgi:glycosyltransferase involved in cell wall biosynthesis